MCVRMGYLLNNDSNWQTIIMTIMTIFLYDNEYSSIFIKFLKANFPFFARNSYVVLFCVFVHHYEVIFNKGLTALRWRSCRMTIMKYVKIIIIIKKASSARINEQIAIYCHIDSWINSCVEKKIQ